MRFALWTVPPYEAVIDTALAEVTDAVVTVNDAELLPAGTITDARTVATPGELLNVRIDTPPVGALPLRTTIPLVLMPPGTEVGFSVRDTS